MNYRNNDTGEDSLIAQRLVLDANVQNGTDAPDTLTGDDGADDELNGFGGNDTLSGLGGADTLFGGDDNDTLNGGAGNDSLNGGTGNDVMDGGPGDDTYTVDSVGDLVHEAAGEGNDRIYTSTASYALAPGSEVEILSTSLFADTMTVNLTGNEFRNALYGNNGVNILNGGGEADTLIGFGGDDQYYVDDADDVVMEAVGGGNDRVFAGVSYTLRAGQEVEKLTATDLAGLTAINLTGNEFANTIYGNAGNNSLNGAGGVDALVGLGGDDFYYVDNSGDDLYEHAGEGNDRVLASVNFTLKGGQEIETLIASDLAGTTAIDLTGNEFANIIYGNAGNNSLNGAGGVDTLVGLAGDDLYYVDKSGDDLYEHAGEGNDRVVASVNFTLKGGQEIETLSADLMAAKTPINLTGNEFANAIYGNAGFNALDGKAGADTLTGFGGDDFYYVDNAADVVNESAGGGSDRVFASASYTLAAGTSVETLLTTSNTGRSAIDLTGNELSQTVGGNNGDNILSGLGGNDTLSGLDGNDILIGGAGADHLKGGAGNDTVSYASSPSAVTIDHMIRGFGGDAEGDVLGQFEAVIGSAFDDVLIGGYSHTEVLIGGPGADYLDSWTVSYATSASGVTIDLHNHSGSGGDAEGDTYIDVQNATGSAFDDMLIAGPGNNVLNGGAGDDWYFVDNAGDTVVDGFAQGTLDRVFASVSYTLSEGGQIEVLSTDRNAGTAAIDFTGNSFSNTIYGNDGNNRLTGKAGNDVLVGLGGSDTFVYTQTTGTADDDRINGFDAVNAHAGHDVIDVSGRGLHFADLGIAPAAGGIDTLISLPGTDSIYLFGVSSGQLDAGDFVGLI